MNEIIEQKKIGYFVVSVVKLHQPTPIERRLHPLSIPVAPYTVSVRGANRGLSQDARSEEAAREQFQRYVDVLEALPKGQRRWPF
jgi:hypothetical protein